MLYLRKRFLLPEATAKVCKLPVAIVGCRWLSSAVACKLPVAVVGSRKNCGREALSHLCLTNSCVLTGL